MTKSVWLVAPLFFLEIGCTSSRIALRLHEPADRWALAVSPKMQAPLERPVQEQFRLPASLLSFVSVPGIFVAAVQPLERGRRFMIADAQQKPLLPVGSLDLIYPPPAPIIFFGDGSDRATLPPLMTAEARVFGNHKN